MQPLVYNPFAALHRRLPRRIGRAIALGLLGLASLAGAARVQSDGAWTAQVRGVGRVAVPPGAAISVVARDFDDVNTRLQPVLEQALTAAGYRVEPHAALQLVYNTELSNAAPGARSSEPATGNELGDINEEVEISSEGPDTGPHPAEFEIIAPQVTIPLGDAPKSNLSRYSLTFVVVGVGQAPVWQGGVTTMLPPQDPLAVAQAMVPLLVPQIGKTVEARHAFPN